VEGWFVDLPDPSHDSDEVQRAAREILSRPEYNWGGRSLIDRIGDWIAEQLSRISVPLGLGNIPVWLGWVVLGMLVVVILALLFRSRHRMPGLDRSTREGRVVVAEGEADIDWEAEVARCEAEGRWREGLRARYRVLVGRLAADGVIPDLVGRTTGELVADAREAAPAVAPAFARATSQFEAVWYGAAPSGAAEAERFAALAAEVRAGLGTAAASP
jgi:hypothetical protein